MTTNARHAFAAGTRDSLAALNMLGEEIVFDTDSATAKVIFTRRSEYDYQSRRRIFVDEIRAQKTDVPRSRTKQKITRTATSQTYILDEAGEDSTGWFRWRITEFRRAAG